MTYTEKAIHYIQTMTEWHFDDVQIFDEQRWEWIARVTTTHNSKRGEPEISFIVAGNGTNYVTYELDMLPKLIEWGSKQ